MIHRWNLLNVLTCSFSDLLSIREDLTELFLQFGEDILLCVWSFDCLLAIFFKSGLSGDSVVDFVTNLVMR